MGAPKDDPQAGLVEALQAFAAAAERIAISNEAAARSYDAAAAAHDRLAERLDRFEKTVDRGQRAAAAANTRAAAQRQKMHDEFRAAAGSADAVQVLERRVCQLEVKLDLHPKNAARTS